MAKSKSKPKASKAPKVNSTSNSKLKIKDQNLKLRLLSGIVMAIAALTFILFEPIFGLLCIAAAGLCFYEWYKMVNWNRDVKELTFISLIIVVFPMLISSHLDIDFGIISLVILGITFFLFLTQKKHSMRHAFAVSLGIPYIGIPMIALMWLRSDPNDGLFLILYVFFVTWGSDIVAYFIGKNFGKNKLAPYISPNKTWEGLAGAGLGGVIGGLIVLGLVWMQMDSHSERHIAIISLFDMHIIFVIFVSLVLGLLGQVGDLMESYVKRYYGVKDSGNLIPGHGGILDRVDALLLVASLVGLIHYCIHAFYRMSVAATGI